jgi:hypothetical protein
LSSNFYTRTDAAFTSQQAALTENEFAELKEHHQIIDPSDHTQENSGANKSGAQLELNKDNFLAPGFSFLTEFRWCVLDDRDDKAAVTCHEKTMIDRSQRLFFLFKALETPSLFGHGIASFRVLALNPNAGYRMEEYNYPHDVVAELLYDAGFIGLGLLLVALMFSIAGFFHFVRDDPALLSIGGFGLFIFISSLAGGDFYDFRLFWLVALVWSTPTASYQKIQAAQEPKSEIVAVPTNL